MAYSKRLLAARRCQLPCRCPSAAVQPVGAEGETFTRLDPALPSHPRREPIAGGLFVNGVQPSPDGERRPIPTTAVSLEVMTVPSLGSRACLVMLSLLTATAGGCGNGDSATGPPDPPDPPGPSGPITIQTVVAFFPRPVRGTFEVVVGSELLGCTRGTFVDTPVDPEASSVRKELTCTERGSGTFRILFHPITAPGWNIVAGVGTGDFVGLQGEGTFSFVPGPGGGEETFTGTIRYVR